MPESLLTLKPGDFLNAFRPWPCATDSHKAAANQLFGPASDLPAPETRHSGSSCALIFLSGHGPDWKQHLFHSDEY
jgi:hypothetical protein